MRHGKLSDRAFSDAGMNGTDWPSRWLGAGIVFGIFPQLDIALAGLFYDPYLHVRGGVEGTGLGTGSATARVI